jgi:hypothetical protein
MWGLHRHSTEYIRQLEPGLQRAAVDSYADALRVVFICQAAVAFLDFLVCLAIEEKPLPYVLFSSSTLNANELALRIEVAHTKSKKSSIDGIASEGQQIEIRLHL